MQIEENEDIIVIQLNNGIMEIDKHTGLMISWEGNRTNKEDN